MIIEQKYIVAIPKEHKKHEKLKKRIQSLTNKGKTFASVDSFKEYYNINFNTFSLTHFCQLLNSKQIDTKNNSFIDFTICFQHWCDKEIALKKH